MKEYYNRLKELAMNSGASLFGVADITELKKDFLFFSPAALKPMKRAVVIGVKLLDGVLEDIIDHPTQVYFHHYRQINYLLDRIAQEIAFNIEKNYGKAIPVAASQTIDWQNQRGHLSHKLLGVKAGLGWLGRNNLLVNPRFGSRLRLVSILTDLELPADQEIEGGCKECRECLSVCPAHAIKESPEDFDHIACFSKLKEFRNKGFVGQYICGVCVKACRGKEK